MAQVGNQFHITGCQTNDAIFGGNAYDGNHVYVPCDSLGVVALNINPANATPISVAWSPPGSGYSPGPPILAGGYIWATNQFGGTLHRITPDGMTDTTFTTGTGSRFNTPAADSGRIFIAQTTSIRELNFGNVTPPAPPPISTYTVFRNESLHLDYWDDGNTWYEIDGNLRLTIVPPVAETAIVSINIDLWTTQAGYNQDVGIFMIDNGSADQLLAWEESGGNAGTFSPNAASVAAAYHLNAGTAYRFKLKWKASQAAPGATIYAGAGTAGTGFSPTTLIAQLFPGSGDPLSASRAAGYSLASSDGAAWTELDPSNLRLSVTPTTSQRGVVGGGASLSTDTAGYNQDLGVFVSVNGGADQLLGWKESGGIAAANSANAAFVQAVTTLQAGYTYVFKLKWKANQSAGGVTLHAGAGSPATSTTYLDVSLID